MRTPKREGLAAAAGDIDVHRRRGLEAVGHVAPGADQRGSRRLGERGVAQLFVLDHERAAVLEVVRAALVRAGHFHLVARGRPCIRGALCGVDGLRRREVRERSQVRGVVGL